MNTISWLDSLTRDVSYGTRMFRTNPSFAFVAILSLALGIGANTAISLMGGSWSHGISIGSTSGSSQFTWVSPGDFETMNIPLLAGRGFDRNDTRGSQRVAIVNQTFVQRYLNGADPIGRTVRTHPEPRYPATDYQIVAVVADTKYNSLRGATPPMAFAPALQFPAPGPVDRDHDPLKPATRGGDRFGQATHCRKASGDHYAVWSVPD
jgi:hypothetical protein